MDRVDVVVPRRLLGRLSPPMRSLFTGERVAEVADVRCLARRWRAAPVTVTLPASRSDQATFRHGAACDRLVARVLFPLLMLAVAAATVLWALVRFADGHDRLRPALHAVEGAVFVLVASNAVLPSVVISRQHPRTDRDGDVVLPRIPADLAEEWKREHPDVTVRERGG